MSEPKLKHKPKILKRKRKRQTLLRKLMEKEYRLSELSLFSETLNANMTTEAMILEGKRKPGDYVR